MAILTLTLTMRGEPPVTMDICPPVEVAFERQFDQRLGEDMRLEHLYWLAWKQYARTHDLKPFDEWLEDLDDVTPEDGPPLDRAPSSTASSEPASPPA